MELYDLMEDIKFNSIETGSLLRGRFLKVSDSNKKSPLIIMLTGDGPKGTLSLSWTNIPPKLQDVGIASFLFDFEGLGNSEGERKNLSLSIGIDNLKSAFSIVMQQDWVDKNKIGIFASSFGATVLLSTPDIANKICAIGLKSPATFIADAYFQEIGDEAFDNWRKNGYLEKNGYNFEIFIDALKYNTFVSALEITTPCFITQGDCDEIIPVQHTKYLYECLKTKEKHLEIFKGANHGYSTGNSWEAMATMFVNWFSKKLK